MAKRSQGESMGIPGQASETAKAAPKAAPKKSRGQGAAKPGPSQELASDAPSAKGAKNQYGGPWKGDHPSEAPHSMAVPTDSSRECLDGCKLKK